MAFEPLEISAFPETIEGDRIRLLRCRSQDVPLIFRTVEKNRAYLGRFMPWETKTRSEDDTRAWFEASRDQWEKKRTFDFGIFLKPAEKYIGQFSVHSISWENHRAELGYWLAESFQGRGYITEAIGIAEGLLFRRGFHRIEIRCSALNERSKNIAERLGYVLEGRLRENSIENGEFRDTLVYAKLKSEWRPASTEAK